MSSLVLCYHAVSDDWDDQLAVRSDTLARQIAQLRRRRLEPAPLDLVAAGRRRTFHVTFDDAYRNISAALQMLARTGVKSTVFACSGLARTGAPLAVPELDGRGGAERLATMSWDELRAHAEAGVEIGSHTITHAHLTELPDAELERELVDSKAEIETELGRPCRYVAYPFGENDARVRAAARGAGYELGFSLRATGGDADARFGCPRVDVYRRDGTLSFALKTSPARRPVVAVLDRLRAG